MKFKKIMIVCIFLLAILTLSAVSAADDNSTISDMQSASEDAFDLTVNEVDLDDEVNELDDGDNFKNQKLSASNEDQIKSNQTNPLEIQIPKSIEVNGYGTSLDMAIYLPKKSNGDIFIYNNESMGFKSFNLYDVRFKPYTEGVYYESESYSDKYVVYYELNPPIKIGLVNFTVRYEDGTNVFEKTQLVDITYVLSCENTMAYSSTEFDIYAPYNTPGKMTVEIDGRQYKVISKTKNDPDEGKTTTHTCIVSPKVAPGMHNVRITYLGDSLYPSKTVDCELFVYPEIDDSLWDYGDFHQKVSLLLPSNAKGKLVIQLYGKNKKLFKTYSKKFVKGKASVAIPKKVYGKFFKIVVKYTGKDYSVKNVVYKNVMVNPYVKIPKTMLQGEKKYVSINMPGKKGVLKLYMQVKVRGHWKTKVFTKKLVKGKAKISLSKFKAGSGLERVKFIETLKGGKKVSYNIYSPFEIYKPLSLELINSHYGKAKVRAQVYKAGGIAVVNKFVTFKIKGKFVQKVKTDSEGEATFKIPAKYKPNTYKVTAQYKKNVVTKNIKIKA